MYKLYKTVRQCWLQLILFVCAYLNSKLFNIIDVDLCAPVLAAAGRKISLRLYWLQSTRTSTECATAGCLHMQHPLLFTTHVLHFNKNLIFFKFNHLKNWKFP
jgi:hypothetical protein